MHGTGHICGDCEEEFPFTSIVTLIQIVLPQRDNEGRLTVTPFSGANGEFFYEPHFYHDGCWAKLQDTLFEILDDEGATPVPDPYGVCKCVMCESDIRPGEPTGMSTTGEFHRSPRSPEGEPSIHLAEYRDMTQFFCLSCIRTVNEDVIEMWPHISYAGECPICTYERNWRTGTPCTHDHEQEEDE
jgi:hypothetical protein